MTHVIVKLQLHISPDRLADLHLAAQSLASMYADRKPGAEHPSFDLTLDTTSNFTIK